MKKLFAIAIISFAIAACSENAKPGDKKAELEQLKKEQATLKEKINKLEKELGSGDSTLKEKSKFVAVTEMNPQTFNHYIEVQARIEGDEDVNVSPDMPGTVTSVLVKAGDKVRQGQVMAILDDKTLRQNMEAMRSQLDMATIMFEKQKNLWDQKIGSEVQFIQARTQKTSLEKQYAAVYEQWDMSRIKSPINGTVDGVNVKIGQSVAPGFGIIRVVNLSKLKVRGEVAESYINKVKQGNDVLVYFPDLGKEIKSKLSYSGRAINSLNRTFNVEVNILPKDGEYFPNQVAVLKIADYSADSSFVVPIGAVQRSSDTQYVYVVENEKGKNVAKRKTVSAGMTYNGLAEIKSGLAPGDKVITTGFQNVIEGDIVKL
jgi:membrane fusion protein, multidrug efflux system